MATPTLPSTILQFAVQYSFYFTCVSSSLGMLGNMLNILVLIRLKFLRNNRCVLYIIVESLSNFTYVTFTLIVTIVSTVYGDSAMSQSLVWCRIRYVLFQTSGLATATMICFAACDQFCSTNYRLYLRQIATMKRARCLICISFILFSLHSILFSVFSAIHPLAGCIISNPVWTQYAAYFFYPVLTGFLPILVASSFSLLAYRNVRRVVRRQIPIERRRLDRQVTAMVLARVAVYAVLCLPFTSYRVYALNVNANQTNALRLAIERLLQAICYSMNNLNYAMNFYLFLVFSPRYRRQVKYAIERKYWRDIDKCCRADNNRVRPDNSTRADDLIEVEQCP